MMSMNNFVDDDNYMDAVIDPFIIGNVSYKRECWNMGVASFFVGMSDEDLTHFKDHNSVDFVGFGQRGMLYIEWFVNNFGIKHVELYDDWERRRRDGAPPGPTLTSKEYKILFEKLKSGKEIDSFPKLQRDYDEAVENKMVDNVIENGWYGRFNFSGIGASYKIVSSDKMVNTKVNWG
jgi:hypothetical protein